jgi:hypothetical protein
MAIGAAKFFYVQTTTTAGACDGQLLFSILHIFLNFIEFILNNIKHEFNNLNYSHKKSR